MFQVSYVKRIPNPAHRYSLGNDEFIFSDHFSIVNSLDEAQEMFKELCEDETTYTSNISRILESTDCIHHDSDYTMKIEEICKREIKTDEDVKTFIEFCLTALNLNFHPDTPFADYGLMEVPILTTYESQLLDKKLDECFNICFKNDIDIYDLSLNSFHENWKERTDFEGQYLKKQEWISDQKG